MNKISKVDSVNLKFYYKVKSIGKSDYISKLVYFPFFLFLFLNISIAQVSKIESNLNLNEIKELKILPLGNSITYDNRSDDYRDIEDKYGYRLPLYNLLKESGLNFDFIGSEHAGSNFLPEGYDDNAGFPGIRKGELANLLKTGWRVQSPDYNVQITPGPYLETYLPDLILLHIGTNDNNLAGGTDANDIKEILDEVDRVESFYNKEIPVIVARIIDRVPNQTYVHTLNNNVQELVWDRLNNPLNPAYPDNLYLANMEDSAEIIYTVDYMGTVGNGNTGDMSDALHPNDKGYAKMADEWFKIIKKVYPNTLNVIEQPKSMYTFTGETIKLEFNVVSEKPIQYQWLKNGVNISGATDSVYIIENIPLSLDSSKYSCTVESGFYNLNSDTVTIYVSDSDSRVSKNNLALYDFEEGTGNIIHNSIIEYNDLDMKINDTSAVNWIPNGLEITGNAFIETNSFATSIINKIKQSNEITLEAWIRSENTTQNGPARIFTISENTTNRNVTLGQDADKYSVRLRTTETSSNGLPSLFTKDYSVKENLTHLVYSRNSSGEVIFYINGKIDTITSLDGDFSNWDPNYKLGIGNEIQNDRLWLGKYYLLGIYDRALDSTEVKHNFNIKFDGIENILDQPTNLTAEVTDSTKVILSWVDNSLSENGFIIERKSLNSNNVYHIIDNVGPDITSFTDKSQKSDSIYTYRISAYNDLLISDYSNEVEVKVIIVGSKPNGNLNDQFKLYQNYPNPFNPKTKVQIFIPLESRVKLNIYNSLGEIVKNLVDENLKRGYYEFNFNAEDLASGVYYIKVNAFTIGGNKVFDQVKKAILLK